MRRKGTYLAGLAAAGFAVIFAAIGLSPMGSPMADASAPATSNLSMKLGALHTQTHIEPTLRDYDLISDLVTWTGQNRTQAKDAYRQYQCLAEAIYYEARSESVAGQKAVAEVIQNRAKSKHYPNTICGVVYQGAGRRTGCQFSFTCDGSLKKKPYGKYWEQSEAVASLALTRGYFPVTKRATHYHTDWVNPPWSKTLVETDKIGSHIFYRFKNRREHRQSNAAAVQLAPPPI